MIKIIGIGSPFGDDAAGLEAARRLAESPPPGAEVVSADRPGARLVDLLDGATAAILIDAARSGAPPGTLHDLDLADAVRASLGLVSSHDLGVAEALRLGAALGRAPARGRVIAIEASPRAPGDGLSERVDKAVARAVEVARQWAGRLNGQVRERIELEGTVQGVGMRPHLWRLAASLGLAGHVRNVARGVEIEVEGPEEPVAEFCERVAREAPPAAEIETLRRMVVASTGAREFVALPSAAGEGATLIPPDLAICADCAAELLDPSDRRYRYPFINCTQCGPRFSVVEELPYDRERTTMRTFAMCADCAREYADPANRRFRAEPIACAACGPRAWLEGAGAGDAGLDAVARAAAAIRNGAVLAVLGVGGAHLTCDAADDSAVARLRAIKRRPHKPLAVMVESLEFAHALAELSAEESALLASPAAPIVLVRRRAGAALSAGIAPGNDHIGLMLAYSPLHLLLVRDARRALVMTSANLPGEPLCATTDEMRVRFAGTADALLLHDRPIHQRCDDGVVVVAAGASAPIRRSRGATPRAIEVPLRARRPVLGVGGDIKNTFCLLSGRSALMSQYVGTLENASTQQHFVESLARLKRLTGIEPALVAHDLHPASASRALAERLGVERIAVQHHHAHVAACLAENGHAGRAIGIAFDGTGYGTDGAIWGGEALIAGSRGFDRVAHLEYLPLAGGDAAIRHPARIAASYLVALTGGVGIAALRDAVGGQQVRIISRMVERGINTVPTSSCGRLFDAVAALLGVRYDVTYEAQAAIELESLARGARDDGSSYDIALEGGVVRLGPLFAGVADDLRRGVAREIIARRFHATVARMVAAMARAARAASAIDLAALSGGCFQNRILLADAVALLRADGFSVVTHRAVPANDGGLALGQAVVAAALDSPEQTEVADVPWRAG